MSNLEGFARRAANGDRQAFEALCRALQEDVWRYCWALTGDDDLAAEAAQETFLRSVTAIRRFRGEGPVRVWFLVLARRAVAEVLRRAVRARQAGTAPPTAVTLGADHAGEVLGRLVVESLEPDLRQAFVLTQVLGLTYEEAGRVAGCKVGTIRSRVFRARARLMEEWRSGAEGRTDAEGDE